MESSRELFGELISFKNLECYDAGKTEVSGRHGGVRKTEVVESQGCVRKHGKNKISWKATWRALLERPFGKTI